MANYSHQGRKGLGVKIHSCWFCDSKRVDVCQVGDKQAVHCTECGAYGPLETSEELAIVQWNYVRKQMIQEAGWHMLMIAASVLAGLIFGFMILFWR